MSKQIILILPVIALLFYAIPAAMAQDNGYSLTVNDCK